MGVNVFGGRATQGRGGRHWFWVHFIKSRCGTTVTCMYVHPCALLRGLLDAHRVASQYQHVYVHAHASRTCARAQLHSQGIRHLAESPIIVKLNQMSGSGLIRVCVCTEPHSFIAVCVDFRRQQAHRRCWGRRSESVLCRVMLLLRATSFHSWPTSPPHECAPPGVAPLLGAPRWGWRGAARGCEVPPSV